MHPLKDKVVLVSGSSMGIGFAIAKRCLELGAKVMIHGHDEKRVAEAQERLGASQDQLGCHTANFLEKGASKSLMQATIEHFGHVDCLINNAGIYPRNHIDNLEDELFQQVIKVNLKTPMFLIKEAMPYFRKKGKGAVLNIGSINAYCGQKDLLVYSVSKGGLMAMTRNLGHALGKEGVRVNQLNVGWTLTETEIKTRKAEGFSEDWEENLPPMLIPSGRLIRPEQIAEHAVFWVSDLSAPSNGVVTDLEQFPIIGRNLIPEITQAFK